MATEPKLYIQWIFPDTVSVEEIGLTDEFRAVPCPIGALWAAAWADVPCRAWAIGTSAAVRGSRIDVLPAFTLHPFQNLMPGHTRIGGVLVRD